MKMKCLVQKQVGNVCFPVSHHEFMKDGLKHMRLKFYIEGSEPGLKGTVHSESKQVGVRKSIN